jgi:hypothetical protein
MFSTLSPDALHEARDAARLLYDNRSALGLDAEAIKLDTLAADISAELERRGTDAPPDARPAGMDGAWQQETGS